MGQKENQPGVYLPLREFFLVMSTAYTQEHFKLVFTCFIKGLDNKKFQCKTVNMFLPIILLYVLGA